MKAIKYLGTVLLLLAITMPAFAQNEDTYEKVGKDEFKVTRYYEDGSVRETGIFKDGIANGTWKEYTQEGKLKTEATYVNGKKEGKWLVYSEDGEFLYELFYQDNKLADANRWKIAERNAVANN